MNLSDLDLRSIQLFQSVASSGSFTKAGESMGLTQSAVSRQIQQLEQAVGAPLFHRTTRSVRLTEAGESFLQSATRALHDFEESLTRFRETYVDQPPQVRLGLSQSVAHSHLPGLLTNFRRTHPNARLFIHHIPSDSIREKLLNHELDIGIFTKPTKRPAGLHLQHAFRDDFIIITPTKDTAGAGSPHDWLALDRSTSAGALIHQWLNQLQPGSTPSTELSNFDVIINLVALGLGSSIVPRRAVRLYGPRLNLREIEPKKPFYREIGVYCRKQAARHPVIAEFVKSILFGWKGPVD